MSKNSIPNVVSTSQAIHWNWDAHQSLPPEVRVDVKDRLFKEAVATSLPVVMHSSRFDAREIVDASTPQDVFLSVGDAVSQRRFAAPLAAASAQSKIHDLGWKMMDLAQEQSPESAPAPASLLARSKSVQNQVFSQALSTISPHDQSQAMFATAKIAKDLSDNLDAPNGNMMSFVAKKLSGLEGGGNGFSAVTDALWVSSLNHGVLLREKAARDRSQEDNAPRPRSEKPSVFGSSQERETSLLMADVYKQARLTPGVSDRLKPLLNAENRQMAEATVVKNCVQWIDQDLSRNPGRRREQNLLAARQRVESLDPFSERGMSTISDMMSAGLIHNEKAVKGMADLHKVCAMQATHDRNLAASLSVQMEASVSGQVLKEQTRNLAKMAFSETSSSLPAADRVLVSRAIQGPATGVPAAFERASSNIRNKTSEQAASPLAASLVAQSLASRTQTRGFEAESR